MDIFQAVLSGMLAVALLVALVVLVLILIRVLWDPIYCCWISGPGMKVILSSPLFKVTDSVHISEHLVTSGSDTWLQGTLTKYSRMVIVAHGRRLALFNPCPLTDDVKAQLATLGTVVQVAATNCFHYMCLPQYRKAFPESKFIIPSGLFLKRPEFREWCVAYPEEQCGSLFHGTQYFRLPDFNQEHVIFVEAANLMWSADMISPHQPDAPNPGRTVLSPLIWSFVGRLCMSAQQWYAEYGKPGSILFADYSRQFRIDAAESQTQTELVWKQILALPIKRVATAHGHYHGWVDVTPENLKCLLKNISRPDTCWDSAGRFIFTGVVLGMCSCAFSEWKPLFDRTDDSDSGSEEVLCQPCSLDNP